MKAIIYHNSRCSKCRGTLDLLNDKGVDVEIINYLEHPPTKSVLADILQKLNKQPQEIIRFGESLAKELGISKTDKRDTDEWLSLLVSNPILIERPIVIIGDKAVLGRPPENVLALLDS